MVRILSVVDAYTRECLAVEADTSLGSGHVTRVLERVIAERGRPEYERSAQRAVPPLVHPITLTHHQEGSSQTLTDLSSRNTCVMTEVPSVPCISISR
jgi:hypothetical protein